MREQFKFWITIPTRWRDMDAMGHVNSATYLTYFEIARMSYFERVDLPKLKVAGKIGPGVVSQTCNYRQQVFHPSELEAGVRTTKIGSKSFAVAYEFYLAGTNTLVTDGSTVMCWIDYEAEKAIPVPDALRNSIRVLEEDDSL